MKTIMVWMAASILVAASAGAAELAVYPANAPEPTDKFLLLPKAEDRIDGDAVELYSKAAKSLPVSLNDKEIAQWTKVPLDDLPLKRVESTLKQAKPALQLLAEAAKCKGGKWPAATPGKPFMGRQYLTFAQLLALQARYQIAKGRHEQAVGTMQRGLSMTRHLAAGPTLIHGMVGLAAGEVVLNQAELLLQQQQAPNLYYALQALSRPLVDLTSQFEKEMANLKQYNWATRQAFKKRLKPGHDRARLVARKLDRHVAALQVIEALRLYAAAHEGKLPNRLSDFTTFDIPDDPVTETPFVYSGSDKHAVLEAPAPKGGREKDAMRYEISVKE